MKYDEWQEKYLAAKCRADRVHRMILDRAREAARLAGLDPELLGIHPHNAMVCYKAGKPWPGVDYSLVRKCLWLQRKAWIPHRLAEAYGSRTMRSIEWGKKS